MSLFQLINFKSHAGIPLDYKIECDSLGENDWKCLAMLAKYKLPHFREVIGIPRGGIPFAEQLSAYVNPKASLSVIVDDVFTTGSSLFQFAADRRDVIGCVAFARSPTPRWIVPVWSMW